MANQLKIFDIDDTLVRPWALPSVLVDAALVTARVNLVAWIIQEKVVSQVSFTAFTVGPAETPLDVSPYCR